ncbi:hypothetical protein [Jiangella alkaliphila]|uniref:hypothetical protein n=1 Tax=Jiangella alkaliphila TaxID=419479 RepID=UPI0006290C69|nr:hypothetical protein [Jiangella alkaliphila]
MVRVICTMERCWFRLSNDLEPAEMARQLCKHIETAHAFRGEEMISHLERFQIDDGPVSLDDLLIALDRPAIAVDSSGRTHAMPAGRASRDGQGSALCRSVSTVVLRRRDDGTPLTASAIKEPRCGVPQCTKCRSRLRRRW